MSEAAEARARRKVRVGKVVSDKMDKSVVVSFTRRVTDDLYGKQTTRTKKIVAHDEENSARLGDTVRVMETRPLSKTKRWRLVDIVLRAK